MNMKTQLDIYKIEKDTHVPMKFRHPQFNKVLWLASYYYYTHQGEYLSDIGCGKDLVKQEHEKDAKDTENKMVAKKVLSSLISHLRDHYNLSKTNHAARKSIPTTLIGKDVEKYLNGLNKLLEEVIYRV
ncbi:hypothetical protein CANTEDRAFT_116816 [Yamadazyma tenuis ATCC 10573]|uniref:Jumonji helical domain-containing protein n=2 Tax=Candida tenuis TaxID=2315449 RepID=G3BBZ9_CANTC|nr:uncharacterized protein CANTEDRAFT_116816 [Yamadazyma tenuis ATCC 10573]EGV61251.1 hypothetical protein CANTEDRAFT_116816 [Yamadazyma tenuis ATCC 10573]